MARMINFMSCAVYHNLKCEHTEWEIRKQNEEEKEFAIWKEWSVPIFSIRDSCLMTYMNLVEKSQVSLGIFPDGTVLLGLIVPPYLRVQCDQRHQTFSHLHSPVCVSFSVMSNSVNPLTVACQAPLLMEFSRQEHWRG